MNHVVKRYLDEGRALLKTDQETQRIREEREHHKLLDRWGSLVKAIRADLGEELFQVAMPDGGDFDVWKDMGAQQVERLRVFTLRFSPGEGLGDIARVYGISEDQWHPWNGRYYNNQGWAAVRYQIWDDDEDVAYVDTVRESDWFWVDSPQRAIALAEQQYAERNKLILQAEERTKRNKARAEKRALIASLPKTPAEQLVEALQRFISHSLPQEKGS